MNTLLSISRRNIIEARLAKGQEIVASAVAVEFDISEDAVLRDLRTSAPARSRPTASRRLAA
jgi:hypothetical protein